MFNLKAFDLYYGWCIKLAGKIDDLKVKYPEFIKEIDEFVLSDPSSGKNKYLEWMIKQLKAGFKKEDIIPTVKLFHKVLDKLDKKDINQYGTVKDLEDKLKAIDTKSVKEKRQVAKENGKKLYEDENYVLIRPDDKNACMTYGKGTKWCITMENTSYYEQYKGSNVVFYFLINKHPTGSNFDKIAFAYMRDDNNEQIGSEIYDAEDKLIGGTGRLFNRLKDPLGNDLIEKITGIMENDLKTVPKSLLARLKSGEKLSEHELNELMNSEDEEVRRKVAETIDPKYLYKMMYDEDQYVRRSVAKRAPINILPDMIDEPENPEVEYVIAERIDPKYLPKMYERGGGSMFRDIVAERADLEYLDRIMKWDMSPSVIGTCMKRVDYNPEKLKLIMKNPDFNQENFYDVRSVISRKLPPEYLPLLMNDKDPYVRINVAKRIDSKYLLEMLNNEPDDMVKKVIQDYVDIRINLKSSSNKNRAKQDIRNDQPLRKNYDYGEGLYSGDMGKYKSVSDFLKSKRKKRKKILNAMLEGK